MLSSYERELDEELLPQIIVWHVKLKPATLSWDWVEFSSILTDLWSWSHKQFDPLQGVSKQDSQGCYHSRHNSTMSQSRILWWHSRIESLQVILTFNLDLDLDLDCDNYSHHSRTHRQPWRKQIVWSRKKETISIENINIQNLWIYRVIQKQA